MLDRWMMPPHVRMHVEAILSTDDTSTDEELVQRFMLEDGASLAKAEEWVSYRENYRGGKLWRYGR